MEFTQELFNQLVKQYKEAVSNNQESFIFNGQELLTAYAKYLIEHLEPHYKG